MLSAIYDAPASFYRLRLCTPKLWWAGRGTESSSLPDNAGYQPGVQFTTSEIGVSGGEGNSLLSEAAIMATIPTPH